MKYLLFLIGGIILKKRNLWIAVLAIILIGIIIFFMFFHTKTAKNLKIGNNTTSQEIVDYILSISSYEATIKVEVESSKNKNQYRIKQQYKGQKILEQEVLEPSNIAGVKIVRDENQLTLENTNLNLITIFENYEGISSNSMDLIGLIENYKQDEKASWKEMNDQISMKTENEREEKILWIDKKTGNPIRLEIEEKNKNTRIYILYNEVNINCF